MSTLTLSVKQIADGMLSGATEILEGVSNSAKAEAIAFMKGKSELYEFQMTRYESTDRQLLNKMADREKKKDDSLSEIDAMKLACTKFEHTEEITNGEG